MYFFIKLFGGYATPRKHIVFSRLALNSNFYVNNYTAKNTKWKAIIKKYKSFMIKMHK
jgi:hypothetical protein